MQPFWNNFSILTNQTNLKKAFIRHFYHTKRRFFKKLLFCCNNWPVAESSITHIIVKIGYNNYLHKKCTFLP